MIYCIKKQKSQSLSTLSTFSWILVEWIFCDFYIHLQIGLSKLVYHLYSLSISLSFVIVIKQSLSTVSMKFRNILYTVHDAEVVDERKKCETSVVHRKTNERDIVK